MKQLIVLGLLAWVTSAGAAHHEGVEEARRGIDAGNAKLTAAVAASDADSIAPLYTEDAIVLPDGAEAVSGRAAVGAFWAKTLATGVRALELETQDVIRSGDLATETGGWTMTIQPEGQSAVTARGKYVVVWKKTPEGWLLHRDIWNDDPPPSP